MEELKIDTTAGEQIAVDDNITSDASAKVIDTLDYRGYHIDFFDDDYGQQIYTIWKGHELCFGSFNMMYKQDMIDIIDTELDTIKHFDCGARLTWFENGTHRDIKLVYRLRILKVWLVADESKVNVQSVIDKAQEIIDLLAL